MNHLCTAITPKILVDLTLIRQILGWTSTTKFPDEHLLDAINSMGILELPLRISSNSKPGPESITFPTTAGLHLEEGFSAVLPVWYGADQQTLASLRTQRQVLLLKTPMDLLTVRASGCNKVASLCPAGGVMTHFHWQDIAMMLRVHTIDFQENAGWLTEQMPEDVWVGYHLAGYSAPTPTLKIPWTGKALRCALQNLGGRALYASGVGPM